ncbi:MAG: magnesium transporter [Sphaerochaetaceae bacterium]|nr:magnesium transporter [Sphaerochaetaceae bacterium]
MATNFGLLRDYVTLRNWRALKQELSHMQEVDIAFFIESLPADQALTVFRTLDKDIAAEVFSNLSTEQMQQLITNISDDELRAIMSDLMVDDAVDMLGEMPASVVKRVLKHTSVQDRQLINQFLRYPENSAGSIMTAEFIELKREMTVGRAINHIRTVGEDKETVYTCYVTGVNRALEGVITVKTLLLATDDQRIETLMETDVISARTNDDQENVADTISRYDLLAIPVVDQENRLVGIITVDDVLDVIEEENTEDFEKMSAMAPSDKPYLKTGVFSLAKNRIVWLLVLMVSGMITGKILGHYEAAFSVLPILVTFIPMLTDTGGNAGSQSSTLVIRGMAVNEISTKNLLTVLWKEIRVAVIVGFLLAGVNFVRLMITENGDWMLSMTVSLALYATVLMAKTIGGILPIIAKKCKLDPAIMAAPLITTIVDACSLVIYFSIAEALLRI